MYMSRKAKIPSAKSVLNGVFARNCEGIKQLRKKKDTVRLIKGYSKENCYGMENFTATGNYE